MLSLDSPIKFIPRIGPKYQKILDKMGLRTVRDLLLYFPFRYDDFSRVAPVSTEFIDQLITVEGIITKTKNTRLFRKRMTLTEIRIEDENGKELKAVWFNQPFILETLRSGMAVRLSGKLTLSGKIFSMTNPAWERSGRDATNTARLVPVYSETAGITSKWIRWQIKTMLPAARELDDIIPRDISQKYHLYDTEEMVTQLHFPKNRTELTRAQKTLAFQEMLLVQLKALQVKKVWEGKSAIKIGFDEALIKNFVDRLPFKLTDAQRKASFEILRDTEKPQPMNRLLNGDVGSGKTVVAAIAAFQVTAAGHQAAIMAPTEVLAKQHFENFCELFEGNDNAIALLTNSYQIINKSISSQISKNKKTARINLLEDLAQGKIDLLIGTHALIQKDVKFKDLALVIIDEQHRFGVAQRAALQSETILINDGRPASIPHLLTMTATPIPRTLAIAFFGSLDLSVLDEMPKNRKPIETKTVGPEERRKVYEFIRKQIQEGRQAFVILPLVEQSKSESMADVKAATQEYERLSEEIFPEFKLGLLHGRLKAKEKEEVMRDFKDKKSQVLVSTSVVEVGIDVPNATVMIIENAERFGLSQLHQFRGRIGRSNYQSCCFLFSGGDSERLKAMEETNDGFEIAERDLKLRGPGQFFGTVQSGIPDIAMENLTNIKLIKFARAEAQEILAQDPLLKNHPVLRDELKKFEEKIHLE
jgi:ATP-dependent DNA helicase RecG